jgi:hypothetical protein
MPTAVVPQIVPHFSLHLADSGYSIENTQPKCKVKQISERRHMSRSEVDLTRNMPADFPIASKPVYSHPALKIGQCP